MLTNTTHGGSTAYIDADLRDPDSILADPVLESTLDLSRPVALMLVSVLYFLGEDDDYQTVNRRSCEDRWYHPLTVDGPTVVVMQRRDCCRYSLSQGCREAGP